jgi:6-pyruvoyltetrahydropterin/6-carboxytetrahydropterin synthase
MITVTKKYKTETAHRLHQHTGGCKYIHGHSYRYEITVGVKKLQDSMVMDFKDLKILVQKIIGPWDHALLLYEKDPLADCIKAFTEVLLLPWIPTAENMVCHIADRINERLFTLDIPGPLMLVSVKIWETATSHAEWRADKC